MKVRRGIEAAALAALAIAAPARARADGAFPTPEAVLVPADRPQEIILATNFGLVISEDAGQTWSWSCERDENAFALPLPAGSGPAAPAVRDRQRTRHHLRRRELQLAGCWRTARRSGGHRHVPRPDQRGPRVRVRDRGRPRGRRPHRVRIGGRRNDVLGAMLTRPPRRHDQRCRECVPRFPDRLRSGAHGAGAQPQAGPHR